MADTPYPLPRDLRESSLLVGDGTAGPYGPSQYAVFDTADVTVWARPLGSDTFDDVTSGCTVAKTSGAELDTFSVTFGAAVPATTQWYHQARRVSERSVAVTRAGSLDAPQLEKELSKQASVLSEMRRDINRAIRFPVGTTGDAQLPPLEDGRTLMWEAANKRFVPGPNAADIVDAEANGQIAQAAAAVAVTAGQDAQDAAAGAAADKDAAENAAAAAAATLAEFLALKPAANPATRVLMAELDATKNTFANLQEEERDGLFALVDYAPISALVDLDTQQGVFVRSTDNPAKVWVRAFQGSLNARWFGAVPDVAPADMYTSLSALWDFARATKTDMYFPAGSYEIGEQNWPFRQTDISITELLDCQNITLHGDGDLTVLRTNSVGGADVLQLNGLKNFHIRNLKITSDVSGSASGSNGISITNGFDNITIVDVAIGPCASIDHGTYADGGAGVSVQNTTAPTEWGSLLVDNVRVTGSREGFGFEGILTEALTRRCAIQVTNMIAMDCYIGYKIAYGAATGAIPEDHWSGIHIEGKSINCQRDVALARAHGAVIAVEVVTTKTAAARRLSPKGVAWFSGDTVVDALFAAYAKYCAIAVRGDKGECDYKAQIGGASAGSSGLGGFSDDCLIDLDIGGTAATADLSAVASGADTIKNSKISYTYRTSLSIPASIALPGNNNEIRLGSLHRPVNPQIAGALKLCFGTDGVTETGRIGVFDSLITGLKGGFTGTAGATIVGLYDQGGNFRVGIRNGNGIVVDGATTSAGVGAYVAKFAVYDKSGTLLGYFPLYN